MPSMVADKFWLREFRPDRAVGYITPEKLSKDGDISYKMPGGGFMSTVEDATRFSAHFTNETLLTNVQKQK